MLSRLEGGAGEEGGALNGADLIAQAIDALAIAAFVCVERGRVVVMSRSAEQLVADGEHLRLRGGCLVGRSDSETRMLSSAVRAAASSSQGSARPSPPLMLMVQGEAAHQPLLVEVTTVSILDEDKRPAPAALLVARSPGQATGRAALIGKCLFGLTQAETGVLADLLEGRSAQAISDRAGTSIGTVRTHVRNIFQKAGVHSQLELVARLTAFL